MVVESRAYVVWFSVLASACSGRLGGAADEETSDTGSETTTASTSTTGETTGETSGTSGTDETTSTGTSVSTSTTDDGPRFDLGVIPDSNPDYDPQPCPDPVPGTNVVGETPLGAFTGTRAWFGGNEDFVRLIIFDDTADTAAEAEYAHYNNGGLKDGPALILEPSVNMGVPLTEPTAVLSFWAPNAEAFMAEVTVDELVIGDDQVPELLRGSLTLWPDENAEGVVGPFEAAYCVNYTQIFWGE